jgi:hypothetical protein
VASIGHEAKACEAEQQDRSQRVLSWPSRYRGHFEFSLVLTPPLAANERDLNENDRASRGHSRKDVFARAFMPKIVHGQAVTNEYKTTDITTELN